MIYWKPFVLLLIAIGLFAIPTSDVTLIMQICMSVLLLVVAGIWALNYLMNMLAGEYEMETMVGPVSILAATALNLGVAMIVGWMISRKNRRINMVEALKGTE